MSTEERLRRIERLLHEKIPITRAMGVAVESYDGGQLVITAPLAANHNHLGTAFGGSLSAIATLAGYALIWLELDDIDAHVVIRSSTIKYLRPVRESIRAICRRPDGTVLRAFKEDFAASGKARIQLPVTIEEDRQAAVEFEGTYFALR
jgi:thioesterase domain-containing protein